MRTVHKGVILLFSDSSLLRSEIIFQIEEFIVFKVLNIDLFQEGFRGINARREAYTLTVYQSWTMPFDRLRANGKRVIPFVVSLSNHKRNRLVPLFPRCTGS